MADWLKLAVTQPSATFAAFAIFAVPGKPGANLCSLARQAFARAGRPGFFSPGLRRGIGGTVAMHHGFDGGFHFCRLSREVSPCAALGLGGIGGQLDAIDGKQFASDQPLSITDDEHLSKQLGDCVAEFANKGGNRCEVGAAITRYRHEQHVVTTGRRDSPRADKATRVGE